MDKDVNAPSNEQEDDASKDVVSDTDMSNDIPVAKGKTRSQGSKRLRSADSDKVPEISNGGSNASKKGKGRQKRKTEEEKSEDNPDQTGQENAVSNEENLPEKPVSAPEEDVENGSPGPKAGRGRPKGASKRKSKSLTQDGDGSPSQPLKRGRPKGSPNKTPRLMAELATDSGASANVTSSKGRVRKIRVPYSGARYEKKVTKSPRGRGRPRKIVEDEDASPAVKKGRGRPKGSSENSRKSKVVSGKRGRPRIHPLPTPEEKNKPKVWKPLGRPRKYPRTDPPEDAKPTVRKSRGHPRRSGSKKGKKLSKAPVSTGSSDGEAPKKRGRPSAASKNVDVSPRKRGHPKSPTKKDEADGSSANEEEETNNTNDADTVEKQDTDIKA